MSGFHQTPSFGPATAITSIDQWRHPQYLPVAGVNNDFPTVFGKRMERYLAMQISHSDSLEILSENLQIIDGGRTIGEIDFILMDKSAGELIHLELAYKFYLYDPNEPGELERWIGPNRNDRFVDKMDKLEHRQFPLLFRKQTRELISELNVPDLPWRQELCFKAQLFLPWKWSQDFPPHINPKAIAGFWIHFDALSSLKGALFFLPKKEDWTIDPSLWNDWHSLERIKQQLENRTKNRKATMCWINHQNEQYEKCFIVWW